MSHRPGSLAVSLAAVSLFSACAAPVAPPETLDALAIGLNAGDTRADLVALSAELDATLPSGAWAELVTTHGLPSWLQPVERDWTGAVAYGDDLLHEEGAAPPGLYGTTVADTDLTWCVKDRTSDLSLTEQAQSIRNGLEPWALYTPVTFTSAACAAADIKIRFAADNHGDGADNAFDDAGGVLAHAFYPGSSSEGRVHFDDDETWTTAERSSSSQPIDLQSVTLHEVGHTLGLTHATDTDAVMYDYYSGSLRELQQDDIDYIQDLYPPDDCDDMYAQAAIGNAYVGFAKLAIAFAGSSSSASTAKTWWSTSWTSAEAALDDAEQGAIDGVDSAAAADANLALIATYSDVLTAVSKSDTCYASTADAGCGLASDYGDLALDALADAQASAAACD